MATSTTLEFVDVKAIPKIYDDVRAAFASRKSRDVAFRKTQLLQLAYMLQDNSQRWRDAITSDLGRPALETEFLEIYTIIKHALHAYKHVDAWAKPEHLPLDIETYVTGARVLREPKGVVLIIGPFNFPILCVFGPLIGAVAAGCAAVMKPSENCPAFSTLLAELSPRYLDPDLYRVVNGEIPHITKLLELRWDHIMYTGNGTVGRIIAAAAAKHLTPISLELGGKSPVIVDESADLTVVAKRLLWGKAVNAGQACTAPDYILIPAERQAALIEAFKDVYAKFYPESEGGAIGSSSLSRIINERHFDRLAKLIGESKGTIVLGGEMDRTRMFIAPTIFSDVKETDSLMASEIFGPLLPIVPVKDIDSAIDFVNAREHPLALYVFGNKKVQDKVFSRTTSGAAIANEVIIHAGFSELPFGGVGESGYGAHGGKAGFSTFTHFRSAMNSPKLLDIMLGARFPPYTAKNHAMISKYVVPKIPFPRPDATPPLLGWGKWFSIAALIGTILGYYRQTFVGRLSK